MSGRRFLLPKTPSDYAAIAVAPLLIFLMISSLANFLMLILYHGNFPGRLSWTLVWFTLGMVGVARLSIERDRKYAFGYAAALGIATYLALLRFVDSPIFSLFILAIIAYLVDVIVRDCTLIDDDVDASGQGLIDSGHLFVRQKIKLPPQATSSDHQADAAPRRGGRKTHQPGRTVMYLALAALPLFGLGQFFLRNQADTWSRARWLLAFYLFSSLSLLVTTSFLGLRRYLRQRNVEMPRDVSIGWLTGGLGIIALIMALAYLAPIPGQAIAMFKPPQWLDSPGDTVASRFGWGEEGADESSEGDSTTSADTNEAEKEPQGMRTEANAPPGDTGDGNRKDGPAGSQSGGKKNASDSDSSQSEQSSSSKNQNKKNQPSESNAKQENGKSPESSGDQPSPNQSSANNDPQDSNQSQNQSSDQSSRDTADQERSSSESDSSDSSSDAGESSKPDSGEQDPNSEQDSQSSDQSKQGDSEQQSSKNPASSSSSQSPSSRSSDDSPGSNLVGTISSLFKILIFFILAGIIAVFLWLHRELIAAWWQSLFEGTERPQPVATETEEMSPSAPARPFASFRNPIGTESDLRQIIVITFQAFEAWTREQGTARERDETPAEFIRRVAKANPRMSSSAPQVVDAYNRIAYGRGRATRQDVQAAEKVWRLMTR
ncbi:MAG: DUF4129 domain-containing protein [Rubripirellula sp.]|nr:DUF4129 domain-containing protein [Rubripirellula sp.]